jgi:hypothetical protein
MSSSARENPKPKRFALNIVGTIEDRPRLIRAYGRACQGEFALVMRPRERKAVLVHLTKQGGRAWRSGEIPSVDEGHIRARAKVNRSGDQPHLVVAEGPHKGIALLSYDPIPKSLAEGSVVLVEFNPQDQFAHLVATVSGDAPLLPFAAIDPKEAVALVKSFQKEVPDPGPVTLRGRWTGHLFCDDEKPILRLSRKLAAYGTLEIRSALGLGWSWAFRRDAKWFTSEGVDSGDGYAFLEEAVEAGILGAMRLVKEACSFKDTRRRAAVDVAYGTQHPIAPPKVRKDPIERLKDPRPPKEKKPRKPRAKKAAAPKAAAPKAVRAASSKGLVVVPLVGRPGNVDELLARTTGHISAFRSAPSTANAKKWVKSALSAFGIEPAKVAAKTQHFPDIAGERVFVTVELPTALEHDGQAEAALALVAGAAKAKKGPGFSIEQFKFGTGSSAAPKRARKARGGKAVPAAAPPAASTVDPAKDKALIDAFSTAISQALGVDV